jgi:hypothetical protein
VDVFENFFRTEITKLSASSVYALSKSQADELVEGIDAHLAAAQADILPDEAVVLDSMASPIIVADDRTEPRTTRRAKQVALTHREVVIPVQPIHIDYQQCGRKYPASLLEWTCRNAGLVRAHVLTLAGRPNVLAIFGVDYAKELAGDITEELMSPEHASLLKTLLTPESFADVHERRDSLEAFVYAAMGDAVAAGAFGSNLSFIDSDSGRLYGRMASIARDQFATRSVPISHATLLENLDLPAIGEVSDEDFVQIRLQSEDFAEYRSVLGRVLDKTGADYQVGTDLNVAFRGQLDEIRWRAELLRRDVKDKSLKRYLRSTLQSVTLGSVVSTAATAADHATTGPLLVETLAARFGVSVVLGSLIAMFSYSPPNRKTRLLRFYDVLLN